MKFSDQIGFLSNVAKGFQDLADNDKPGPPAELSQLLLLLYVPIILLACIGALLVITAILGTPKLRTLSNGFLLNLAISDLLSVILACTTLARVFFL